MKNGSLLLSTSLLLLLNSCSLLEDKKDDDTPAPDNTITYGDTLVMKTGRGFSQIAILPWAFGSFSQGANGGFSDGIEIADMTLLPDGKSLQVATSSTLTTQQDPIYNILRYSIDVQSGERKTGSQSDLGEMVRTNFSSFTSGILNRTRGFQPGSDKMFRGDLSVSNFGIATAKLVGDFSYLRSNTFAFFPRVCRNGEIVEEVLCETLNRIDGLKNQRIFTAYKNLNGTQQFCSYYMPSIPGNTLKVGVVEPMTTNSDKAFLFGASDSYLYTIELQFKGTTETSVLTRLDSIALPTGFSPGQIESHPSEDGSTFGILLSNGANPTPNFFSASYNKTNRTWTRNLNGIAIPGLGSTANVDHDLDEAGNVYFDGWANNFQSDSTISLYKATSAGIISIAEDIIKSGSIKQIRFLNGKVYAAVVYSFSPQKGSGSKSYRVAIIKQD